MTLVSIHLLPIYDVEGLGSPSPNHFTWERGAGGEGYNPYLIVKLQHPVPTKSC